VPVSSAADLLPVPAWRVVVTLQVIDAEMARRRLLEESPIPSTNEEPVLFDTSEIPWWAWVRRFHLPEVSAQAAQEVLLHEAHCAFIPLY
jgi:hypothetical protein